MIFDLMDIEIEPVLLIAEGFDIFKEGFLKTCMCGVYACLSIETGRIYIGSSTNIRKRLRNHIRLLKNKKHENRVLQTEYEKYGSSFAWYLLESIQNPEAVTTVEQTYIDLLEPFPWTGNGMNLCRSTYSAGYGKILTQEECDLRAMGRRGGSTIKLKDPEGKIHEFSTSVRRFSQIHGLIESKVNSVISGVRKKHKGWSLPETDIPIYKLKSPDGRIHSFSNIRKFCKENHLSPASVVSVLKSTFMKAKGWTLPGIEIPRNKFSLFKDSFGVVEFESIIKFAEEYDVSWRSIYHLFEGKVNVVDGWTRIGGAEIVMKKYVTSPDNISFRVDDIDKFSLRYGLNSSDLRLLISKEIDSLSGWVLGKNSNRFLFKVKSPEGKEYEFENVYQFAKDHNLNYQGLRRIVCNNANHYKKWTLISKSKITS